MKFVYLLEMMPWPPWWINVYKYKVDPFFFETLCICAYYYDIKSTAAAVVTAAVAVIVEKYICLMLIWVFWGWFSLVAGVMVMDYGFICKVDKRILKRSKLELKLRKTKKTRVCFPHYYYIRYKFFFIFIYM